MPGQIEVKVEKKITLKPEGLFHGKVKPYGNSAHINMPRRFTGKEVYIILKDQVTKEE